MAFLQQVLIAARSSAVSGWALVGLCALLVGVSGCAKLIQPNIKTDMTLFKSGQYEIDPAHTTVLFKVNHMGFSMFVGRFNRFEANLAFDAEHIEDAKLEALIDMASVDVNNPDFEDTLRGRFWFNAEKYPQAKFVTRSVKKIDANSADFTGDLTFRGVTQPLTLRVDFNGAANNIVTGNYTLGFAASGVLQRSAFGLDNYVPTIGDDVQLEIHAEFKKR